MANIPEPVLSSLSKFKLTRKGRKLLTDDRKILNILSKDVPERMWAEILQKEDIDLFIFEIREEIIDEALRIGYGRYMEMQTVAFTAHCAAQAWLKLIDWHFYRHDPGEDPTAYPPCYIPKRVQSWIPDEPPDPSPKDTWCKQELNVVEDSSEEEVLKYPSTSSLEMSIVEEIPQEYWFPGKVNLPEFMQREEDLHIDDDVIGAWESGQGSEATTMRSDEKIGTESEVLQKITDYSAEEPSLKVSNYSVLKTTTPVGASLQGAGDSVLIRRRSKRQQLEKKKVFSKDSASSKSRAVLPPLDIADSISRLSIISDCRLRNLRMDTQYEISSEKLDTPPGEIVKKK